MNPGYDWASRVGNWLGLWASGHALRLSQDHLERLEAKVARVDPGLVAYGPALEAARGHRDAAMAREANARRDYETWLAGRPT